MIPGIVVYRLDDRLFFANAGTVDRLGAEHFHPTIRAAVESITGPDT